MSDELSWFRKVSFAEGWSFILLLGVAMPLKYIWGQPMAVSIVGNSWRSSWFCPSAPLSLIESSALPRKFNGSESLSATFLLIIC